MAIGLLEKSCPYLCTYSYLLQRDCLTTSLTRTKYSMVGESTVKSICLEYRCFSFCFYYIYIYIYIDDKRSIFSLNRTNF